ncbi:MAG TPA: glycosyltransferase 87 family protein, partial [Kineosporiaceae bacterium]|nr:glycosyltransferase 87 family protein [Kineosporiaceae bacterium]
GIDPYRSTPLDPALVPLRDPWLFPPGCTVGTEPCTRINRPTVPTIYPPVAQAEFTAVHLLTRPLGSDGGAARTWQVAAALLALGVLGALLRLLRGCGDPRQAVLWAWCPTVVLETGGGAHVDVLAALLVVGAMASASSGRRGWAGAAFGAAVATKLLPVLVLPALVAPLADRAWRRRARFLAAAVGVVVAVYLPHVLAVGPRVIGFLPGYLGQEGYDGAGRFALLQPWLPPGVAVVVGAVLVGAVAFAVAWRGDPHRPWRGAVLVVGVTFALVGVSYPWYAMLLVVLVALDGRAAWLAVAAAAYPAYLAGPLGWSVALTERLACGCAIALVAVVALRARNAAVGSGTGQPSVPARGRQEARHG